MGKEIISPNFFSNFFVSICPYLFSPDTEPVRLAAAEENNNANSRVYSLLTDLMTYEFYFYDPIQRQFYLDEKFTLDTTRFSYCFGMIRGISMLPRKWALLTRSYAWIHGGPGSDNFAE
jgi:hypothetical protein